MKKKSFVMVLALVLVFAVAVGGVVAWLTDKTDPVKNTFTVGDINITLTEEAGKDAEYQFKMVPGNTIAKDPKVTVLSNSEACYLFVKVEKSTTLDSYISYTMDSTGWTALDGHPGVYYREVSASDTNQDFYIIDNNKVTVKDNVTKTMMEDLNKESAVQPTLTFTAYAVQLHNGAETDWTAAQAWAANFGA